MSKESSNIIKRTDKQLKVIGVLAVAAVITLVAMNFTENMVKAYETAASVVRITGMSLLGVIALVMAYSLVISVTCAIRVELIEKAQEKKENTDGQI